MAQLFEELGGHISRGSHGITTNPHDEPRGDLTDAVVGQLEPHVPGVVDSVLLAVVGRGEVPHENVGRLHVQVNYLVLVEKLQSIGNLQNKWRVRRESQSILCTYI